MLANNIKNYAKKITHFKEWLIFKKTESYTMVGHDKLYSIYDLAEKLEQREIDVDFVECGVWKGGAAAVIGSVIKKYGYKRKLWLFDSFAGMPKPSIKDGEAAQKQFDKDRGISSVKDVYEIFNKLKIDFASVIIKKGWFENTLAEYNEYFDKIALLHLDCDWYDSTKKCLDSLYSRVVPGGYIIIDDYASWIGCKEAVDEFIEKLEIHPNLKSAGGGSVYFRKMINDDLESYWRKETRKYSVVHTRLLRVADEIEGYLSAGGKILDLGCSKMTLGNVIGDSYDYYGIDIVDNDNCKNYAKFDLAKGSFSSFPFLLNFDIVVCSGILEYLELGRIKELLRFIYNEISHNDTLFIFTYTNFNHISRICIPPHKKWLTMLPLKLMKNIFFEVGFCLVDYFPAYYKFGPGPLPPSRFADLQRKIRFKIPLVSNVFGKQFIFILKKK